MKKFLFDQHRWKILFRSLIFSSCIWIFSRYDFSSIWLLIFVVFSTIDTEQRNSSTQWTFTPDFDRCEWLNKFLQRLWPFVSIYVENFVKTNLSTKLGAFVFDRFDLGDSPPRLIGIKVYNENVRSDEIIVDLELFYAGDLQIKMNYHRMKFGVKSLSFHGDLRIILKNLLPKIPFFATIQLFFLRIPTIDFDLIDMANLMDLPIIRPILKLTIDELIRNCLVIPNRLMMNLIDEIDVDQLNFVQPDGILRLDVIEARNLPKKDVAFFRRYRHSIDAYVSIRLGSQLFRTEEKKSLQPIWNESFEIAIDESIEQLIEVKRKLNDKIFSLDDQIFVYDSDVNSDDFVGRVTIPLDTVKKHSNDFLDQWFELIGTKTSSIHLRFQWFELAMRNKPLMKTFQINRKNYFATALLIVYLDRAENLSSNDPSPFCRFQIEHFDVKSSVKKSSTNPIWKKRFLFLLIDAQRANLHVQIENANEKKSSIPLGSFNVPIRNLFNEPNWTIDQIYPLQRERSVLMMKLRLRYLTNSSSSS